jgi:hypothetical protein
MDAVAFRRRWQTWLVILGSTVVAVASARSHVGGWNDGSRLATVEGLVDRGTWAIDDSIFARPAWYPGLYPNDEPVTAVIGTRDKLLIDGHFYSDKSPVPAVLMAGEYALLKSLTGWTAADRPDQFCLVMCLLSSGLAYVVAVWSIDRLGRAVGLPPTVGLLLTASFSLATVAPVYARQVNNHIFLLAAAAALLIELVEMARVDAMDRLPRGRLLVAGCLAGLAYTIDLGAGPVIALGAAGLVAYRRRLGGLMLFGMAALPWLLLHHALNYAIGGTLGPANANLEYLRWPGSPFDTATGNWNHGTTEHFVRYAVLLLVGNKGFLIHNLPLLLAVPAAVRLVLRRVPESPEIVMATAWAVGTWLLYAAASINFSGACCSIRWFVPLLAPGYFVLAVLLREPPNYRRDFTVLSGSGAVMALVMWRIGPWTLHLVPYWWAYPAGGLIAWVVVRRQAARSLPDAPVELRRAA